MATSQDIEEWIRNGENEKLQEGLAANPSAAEGRTREGISFLLLAVYFRNLEAVGLIKSSRKSLDIFEATCTGEEDIVYSLVASKPELVHSLSPDGFSPLGYACFFNQNALARFLVANGADIQAPSANGTKVTPLHSAAASSNTELVRFLVDAGANVQTRQTAGFSPLHSAANNGSLEIIRILLDAGAGVNDQTDKGETPVFFAEKNGHWEAAAYLRQCGGS
jgi:ankyrin repeat protein